jgi:hypothetical protein
MTTVQIRIAALSAPVIALMLAGCNISGKVEQGRVIAYDKDAGRVTLIPELRAPGSQGTYALPAVTVQTPEEPKEMGPAPTPGRLMQVDVKKHRLVYYDTTSQSLHTIPYTPLEERDKVAKAPTAVGVNREKRTITIYSRTLKRLVVLVATDEMLAMPADTFKYGDIVRYYYKDPARALRFMNVSRTDLGSGN